MEDHDYYVKRINKLNKLGHNLDLGLGLGAQGSLIPLLSYVPDSFQFLKLFGSILGFKALKTLVSPL